jgi:hypothetical protein
MPAHGFFRQQRDIFQRPREQADVIEGARKLQHAAARDQAVGRLEGIDAAIGTRADGRAVGLAAKRERHHAGRHRCRGAARGASGCVLGVVGVARLARREVRAFRSHSLAEDHRTRGAQHLHHRCVVARRAPLVQRAAVLGRHIAGIDDVLQPDRYAVERPDRLARAAQLVRGAGLLERTVLVEEGPGLHLRLERADALEAGFDELLRSQQALLETALRFGSGQRPAISVHTPRSAATARSAGKCRAGPGR